MEHYYETIGENWFSYAKFYKDMVEKLEDNSMVIEVGCWKGRSTCCLGVEIINSKKDIKLFCVDAWKYVESTEQPVSNQDAFDKVYEEFLNNIKPIKDYITVCRDYSTVAPVNFAYDTVDFIFIDASHKYEDVRRDILAWLPKIKEGGIIAGHDYFTSVHPGVKQAVDEIFEDKVKFIPEQNVWYYEK